MIKPAPENFPKKKFRCRFSVYHKLLQPGKGVTKRFSGSAQFERQIKFPCIGAEFVIDAVLFLPSVIFFVHGNLFNR